MCEGYNGWIKSTDELMTHRFSRVSRPPTTASLPAYARQSKSETEHLESQEVPRQLRGIAEAATDHAKLGLPDQPRVIRIRSRRHGGSGAPYGAMGTNYAGIGLPSVRGVRFSLTCDVASHR